jgi:hypothetical protein
MIAHSNVGTLEKANQSQRICRRALVSPGAWVSDPSNLLQTLEIHPLSVLQTLHFQGYIYSSIWSTDMIYHSECPEICREHVYAISCPF